MRLQAAIPIDEVEGFYGDDFAGPEERAERRARRKARRSARRERRGERKLRRISRKKAKLQDKASTPRKQGRGGGQGAAASSMQQALPESYEPVEPAWDEASLEPAPQDWSEEDPQVLEAEWTELDQQMDEDLDGELEGIGAFRPLRKLTRGVRTATQKARAKAQVRRSARRATPGHLAGWGPNVRMGRHLRIQAAAGHRAAVIDLKPGLYLVAEIPQAVTRTEFGIAPLLAPLMVTAAKKALDKPKDGQSQPRGPLAALFRRRPDGKPIRLFRAREARPAPPPPGNPPRALPGPVPAPGQLPARAGGTERTFLLPAPNVGWADEHDVAEILGCEACEESWR